MKKVSINEVDKTHVFWLKTGGKVYPIIPNEDEQRRLMMSIPIHVDNGILFSCHSGSAYETAIRQKNGNLIYEKIKDNFLFKQVEVKSNVVRFHKEAGKGFQKVNKNNYRTAYDLGYRWYENVLKIGFVSEPILSEQQIKMYCQSIATSIAENKDYQKAIKKLQLGISIEVYSIVKQIKETK